MKVLNVYFHLINICLRMLCARPCGYGLEEGAWEQRWEKQGVKEQCGSCSGTKPEIFMGVSVGPRAQLEGGCLWVQTPCAE